MINFRNFNVFLTITLVFELTFAIYQKPKCPFTLHPGITLHESYVLTSAAAAFSEFKTDANAIADQSLGLEMLRAYDAAEKSTTSEKIQCAVVPVNCANNTSNYYYRTFDGSCNNLLHPSYGMAKTRYSRMMTPKYGDHSYAPTTSITGAPLPNARLLSLTLFGEQTHPDDFRTMVALQWGQIVAHDITHFTKKGAPEDCCAKSDHKLCYPIALHPHGPIAGNSPKKCLSFARSISDNDAICPASGMPYSEKITMASAYLDLSSAYGNSAEEHKQYRLFKRGLLQTSFLNNRHWMPVSKNADGKCGQGNFQCYNIPDMRNQFIPSIAVMHTILLREHNRIAHELARFNPHYTDEQLFQEARKINIAQYQKITYYDWLPLILGSSYAYAHNLIHYVQGSDYVHDYDERVNPAPYSEFAAAAFRYSHNQIPGWFSMVAPGRDYNETMRLSDYFERPENVNLLSEGTNFDSLIRGMATQLQKRADSNIDKEIKHHFDRKSFEQFGADLKSIDIQRGRDYGLASYNDYRQYCGLPRAYEWSGFINEISADKIALMQKLYASPDDVDLNVGGALESHASESIVGPTFQCIIGRQFYNLRVADRFFFEHSNAYSGFTQEQMVEIRKASISGLFCNNGDYLKMIQPNAFIFPNTRNILRNCRSLPQVDLSKWQATARSPPY